MVGGVKKKRPSAGMLALLTLPGTTPVEELKSMPFSEIGKGNVWCEFAHTSELGFKSCGRARLSMCVRVSAFECISVLACFSIGLSLCALADFHAKPDSQLTVRKREVRR